MSVRTFPRCPPAIRMQISKLPSFASDVVLEGWGRGVEEEEEVVVGVGGRFKQ